MPLPSLFLFPPSSSLSFPLLIQSIINNDLEDYRTRFRVGVSFLFAEEEGWNGKGKYLNLIHKPESEEAIDFISDLALQVITGTDRTYKPSPTFVLALGAFVAEVFGIIADEELFYGYHGMNPAAFTKGRVGYKPFRSVVQGMYEFRFIHYERGFKEHSGKDANAQASRFRATKRLVNFAADYGITPENWHLHFGFMSRPTSIRNPVTLKTARTFGREPRLMLIDSNDTVADRIGNQVNELNAFFAEQVIEPNCHYAFVRMFSQGDRPDFEWDQGGRLYSVGFGNYQQLPGKKRTIDQPIIRQDIRVNGEATVELDIKASHLTILHATAGIPLPNYPDPYIIPGFDRGVVKTFVTMTLGYDRFHTDWTDNAVSTYHKKTKKDLRAVQFETVKDAVLNAIPLLRSWPDSAVRWGDLQYIESEVVVDTIYTLAIGYRVAAMPVHDSIIVSTQYKGLAMRVLSDKFEHYVGVRPAIEAK